MILFQYTFELLLSCLKRVDQRFGPAMPGIVMSDHVLDDEACWCGVPLECHDDLYDAIRGWHHQPDPIPPLVSPQGQGTTEEHSDGAGVLVRLIT